MKKYLFPILLSFIIGSIMAIALISSYDGTEAITVFKNARKVYYVQRGVYSTKDSMEANMASFSHYIYNVEDNKYYAYIGITGNKENSKKLKNYYEKQGYNTYVKEKITDNESFLAILNQYDEILKNTKDDGTISTICNQVLSKYEELVNNDY
ncbi:MAG: hypothetical protein IKE75_06500 [Bacilli bacterium]|nr:hypothetical protein [Bacilli bacterium]